METNQTKVSLKPKPVPSDEVFLACSMGIKTKDKTRADKNACVKVLLDTFAVYSPDIYLEFNGKGSWTPLMFACYFQFKEGVDALLSIGANPNMSGTDSKTPLAIAQVQPCSDITEALLNAGADINYKDKWGKTALFESIQRNGVEANKNIKILVESGIDLNLLNKEGQTIFDFGTSNPIALAIIQKQTLDIVFGDMETSFHTGDLEDSYAPSFKI